jgi:DNA-binding transcriptional LysR family regulator
MATFSIAALRTVREVARLGSLSAAAERLGYTQSAISRQVALAEQAAGRALFERHPRGVRLTEAGAIVVRRGEVVLSELERVHQELEELEVRPIQRLRIGAFSTALAELVPRALAVYSERHPEARVALREGTSPRLIRSLSQGRIDLAVLTAPLEPVAGIELTTLIEDQLFVAVSRGSPLATRATVRGEELARQRWISADTEPGSTLLGAWVTPGVEPDVAYLARDWSAKLGLVANGLGVTVVPGLVVGLLPATITPVRIDDPRAKRLTVLATRSGEDQSPAQIALQEALGDAAAECRPMPGGERVCSRVSGWPYSSPCRWSAGGPDR